MTYLYGATLSNGTTIQCYVPNCPSAKERDAKAIEMVTEIARNRDLGVVNTMVLYPVIDPNAEVMTPEEAAAWLRYESVAVVYKLAAAGKLPAKKYGKGQFRFFKKELIKAAV